MGKKKVIVVGAGSWGGWSALMLQQAGCEVTLVDQYGPGNTLAGSGGKTRIIRMAYGGDKNYTTMVHRALQLWKHYQIKWQDQLYHKTGAIWMFNGAPTTYAETSIPLMKELGYSLEELPLDQLSKAYPQLSLDGVTHAYWEEECGYLEAARSCQVVVEEFQQMGGMFKVDKVVRVKGEGQITSLVTESGQALVADQYVFACGPWVTQLFTQLSDFIFTSRQEVYFYQAPEDHMAPRLPIWVEFQAGDLMRYGIPDHFNQGFKVAYDERNVPLHPEGERSHITDSTFSRISQDVYQRFPALKNAPLISHKICIYENSLDGEFIMDKSPRFSNGVLLAGSSGHGFKMGPAIGEMVKDYVDRGDSFPAAFKLSRLNKTTSLRSQYMTE